MQGSSALTRNRSREKKTIVVLIAVLLATAVVSLTMGRYGIAVDRILKVLWEGITGKADPANYEASVVLFIIRIPRLLLAILVGAALSAAGASYQGLFKNPMVSPDILGVSAGAGFGASIGLLLNWGDIPVQLMALCFGLLAVLAVLALSTAIGRGSSTLLIMVLSGTVISSIFSSFNSLIKYVADQSSKLPEITFWLMGSFAKSGSYRNVIVMLIAVALGALPLFLLRWKMNVLSFGEEEAQSMGVNTKQLRIIIIITSTLLTASSVALCGMIGWVGLIIPHISRFLVGPNYNILLPTSMLNGAIFMLAVDNIARTITAGEIPLGVLTSIIGAPFFIYMMFKGRKGWV